VPGGTDELAEVADGVTVCAGVEVGVADGLG
jgi:hypothetical protein